MNKGPTDFRQAGQTTFASSLQGLATLVAMVTAFLGTPALYGRTINWLQDYTYYNYGAGFEDLVAFTWFLMCGGMIFFLARATLSTALIMGGLALVTRFV